MARRGFLRRLRVQHGPRADDQALPALAGRGHRLGHRRRLTFGGEDLGWEGALATLVEAPGEAVFVALYDVTAHDATHLDSWEGADTGLYRRIKLRVHTLDSDVLAWVYVLDAFEGGLPSARYLGVLADAAERAGAPNDYVMGLRTRPCRRAWP